MNTKDDATQAEKDRAEAISAIRAGVTPFKVHRVLMVCAKAPDRFGFDTGAIKRLALRWGIEG